MRALFAALVILIGVGGDVLAQEPPAIQELGRSRDASDVWRDIREGEQGRITIPNEQAGQLIQSEGDNWRAFRNGPYQAWSAYAILGMIALLSLFFAVRGRVRLQHPPVGVTVTRFNDIDRFTHWFTAICFVILALTGLNLMFGRYVLIPLVGKEAYAAATMAGKYLHNYLSFGFMAGVAAMFVLWVSQNLPNRHDIVWVLKGGGMMGGEHPHASKFNAGQKLIFWAVVIGGLSLTLSGLQLLFPYRLPMFGPTFETLNLLGLSLPTELSPIAEQQLAALWHGAVGVIMTAVIIAHIYIGTVGMQGAFSAMSTGRVDLEWAREHHDLWVDDLEEKGRVPRSSPAE